MANKNNKVKIKIIKLGYFPFEFNTKKIEKWSSKLFSIHGDIEELTNIKKLTSNESNYEDDYLIQRINSIRLSENDQDFIFVISNLPIKDDWFSRILDDKKVIMSFKPILETLQNNNIPLENAVIMLLYSYSLLYKKFDQIPTRDDEKSFMHNDTRGCIFDLSSKDDVIYSCINPIICDECLTELKACMNEKLLDSVKKECKRIKKRLIFRIVSIIQKNPIISALFAISLPISLSLVTTLWLEGLSMIWKIGIIILPIIILVILWIASIKNKS